MISLSVPVLGEHEEALVLEVLRSGRLVRGPMIDGFESAVRRTTGARHAIAVNNGTSALIASLLAHGVGPGDEVITSPLTFVATLNAILFVGARARFADIGDDFNIDPRRVEELMGPRTRALLPVHLYGCPAPMEQLSAIAEEYEVTVVEDAAQALGAAVAGRPVGGAATACFSFYATKNITTGEGGIVTTNDDAVADELRVLRDQGQRGPYDYARPGFNFRMTELEAALGVAQMGRLPSLLAARRDHASLLSALLAGIDGLVLPREPDGRCHVFHQYTVRVTADARLDRDALCATLQARGIDCRIYYPAPVFEHECFRTDRRVSRDDVPNARRAADEVLSLPIHPLLDDAALHHVARCVREALC
ncbi:MAG TPA: DegT/DnrJ/EryC1/StrS family aminotransferase [Acidimicrobiia bacterium]|nr:DegT/DnrJ/EryC1/StrS family aminotransferase [Acidimicrobiia bacterium]